VIVAGNAVARQVITILDDVFEHCVTGDLFAAMGPHVVEAMRDNNGLPLEQDVLLICANDVVLLLSLHCSCWLQSKTRHPLPQLAHTVLQPWVALCRV